MGRIPDGISDDNDPTHYTDDHEDSEEENMMKFLVVKTTNPDAHEIVFATNDPGFAMAVANYESRKNPEESYRIYEVTA